MRTPAAIVLDMDGVILESEGIKTEVFHAMFAEHPDHAAAMAAYHADHPSLPRRRKFERLAELLGRAGDAGLVDELVATFSSRVLERIAAAPFVRGAAEFLAEFAGSVPLYLASVTPEAELRKIVARKGIADRFVRVFGDPPITKEEAVRIVVAAHGADPAAVVLVGDAPADLAVAMATGVEFVGRDSGISFPPPAPALNADMREIAAAMRLRAIARASSTS